MVLFVYLFIYLFFLGKKKKKRSGKGGWLEDLVLDGPAGLQCGLAVSSEHNGSFFQSPSLPFLLVEAAVVYGLCRSLPHT